MGGGGVRISIGSVSLSESGSLRSGQDKDQVQEKSQFSVRIRIRIWIRTRIRIRIRVTIRIRIRIRIIIRIRFRTKTSPHFNHQKIITQFTKLNHWFSLSNTSPYNCTSLGIFIFFTIYLLQHATSGEMPDFIYELIFNIFRFDTKVSLM
jgi:hypothetical protein